MEAFFHASYFHGSYFHERLDGSFHESFHELHAEAASRFRMLPSNLPLKLPRIWRKGSRSSFGGSFHSGGSSHGRFRRSRGYRTTSPSPSLREEGLSTEGSAIHHPERMNEAFPERIPVVSSTKHAPTARRARPSTATFITVTLHVLQPKPPKRSRATPCL